MKRHFRCLIFAIIILLALATAGALADSPATTAPAGRAVVIPVEGEINDFTAATFKRRMAAAEAAGAETIILRMDTPGGLVGAALEMVDVLKSANTRVHTIAYVKRQAYSAGTLISVACQQIDMSPGSMLGDCAPILMSGDGLADVNGANRAKMESPLVATFEDLAARNGYDPLLTRAFVQYQVVVYGIDGPSVDGHGGERRYVTPAEWDELKTKGWSLAKDLKNPVDDELTLLTVSDLTAAKLGLSRGTFPTIEALAASKNLTITDTYETNFGESVVGFLGSAPLRALLGLVFSLSIYFVFSKPGTAVAESAAIVSGVLLFGVPLLTGYAGWLEMLLILAGVGLLALELFVIPGFGVAGVSGIVLLIVGLTLTFVPPEGPALPAGDHHLMPQLPQTRDAFKLGLSIVTGTMLAAMGLWFWLSRYIDHLPYFSRLVLNTTVGSTPEPGEDVARQTVEAAWPSAATTGVAVTDLRPGGVARFFDPLINDSRNVEVVSDAGFVPAGKPLIVRGREGSRIIVRGA